MIAISKTTLGYMKSFLLTEKEAYMSMLIAAGADQAEAYSVIYLNNASNKKTLDEEASRLIKSKKGIRDLIDILTKVNMKGRNVEPEIKSRKTKKDTLDITSKDSILNELGEQYKNTISPKEKTDILIKIADLQKMKQDENRNEDKLVHYYMPINCPRCNLYIEARKKRIEQNDEKNNI